MIIVHCTMPCDLLEAAGALEARKGRLVERGDAGSVLKM